MSDSAIITAFVLDYMVCLVILGWVVMRSRKLRRVTHWTIIIAGLLFIADLTVGAIFALCLDRPQRERWLNYFPDGTHVLAAIVSLCFYECAYLVFHVSKRLTTKKGN